MKIKKHYQYDEEPEVEDDRGSFRIVRAADRLWYVGPLGELEALLDVRN